MFTTRQFFERDSVHSRAGWTDYGAISKRDFLISVILGERVIQLVSELTHYSWEKEKDKNIDL